MHIRLAMIVKDEAKGIEATLRSARSIINSIAILDTGSTDNTVSIIQSTCEALDLPLTLEHGPFVDFSSARNRALSLAEIGLTASDWVLMLSGDEQVEPSQSGFCGRAELEAVLEETKETAVDVRIRYGSSIYRAPRLTQVGSGWWYKGATHEALTHPENPPPAQLAPLTIVHHSDPDPDRKRIRWQRDVELLHDEVVRDPKNARAWFYLGQSYECLGIFSGAVYAYRKRIALEGWDEERYEALFRIGRCLERQRERSNAREAYLEAWVDRPCRAEPLFAIASIYHADRNWPMVYLYASAAFRITFPLNDRLFVDESVYTWRAADLLAASAWRFGRWLEGEFAANKAVCARPDDPRIVENAKFYAAHFGSKRWEIGKRGRALETKQTPVDG